MLREANNKVTITGTLSQVNLNYGTYVSKKNGQNTEYIGGTIDVKVAKDNTVLNIPIHIFTNKYTTTGALSKSFESIEKVMKEFVSIAACGDEAKADKIRLVGSIRMNDFIGKDGMVVSQPRITTNFVNKAYAGSEPEATFSLEFMVQNIAPVVDKEGIEVEPKKINVTVLVPQYGQSVDVVTLTAASPSVINAVETYWETGKCYTANGRVNFTSTTQEYEQAVDFGEPQKKVRTINLSEFLITSGTQTPMDELTGFLAEDIKVALAKRAANIEAQKNKVFQKTTPAPTVMGNNTSGPAFDLGF